MDRTRTDAGPAAHRQAAGLERAAEDRLVGQALSLLDLVAIDMWRRCGGRIALDDLASAGREAIVPLVRRYDPSQSRLEPYLNQRLRWAIHDALRRDSHGRVGGLCAREPTARPATATAAPCAGGGDRAAAVRDGGRPHDDGKGGAVVYASDVDAPDSSRNPEKALLRRCESRQLWAKVAGLPDRQRRLVEGHYRSGERLDELALAMGISKSRASRLHQQALRRLYALLGGERLPRRRAPRARRPSTQAGRRACT